MSNEMSPDERTLRADIEAPAFQSQIGLRWSEPKIKWPYLYLWVKARPTPSGVERYWLRLNCEGYPQQAPTGTFWNIDADTQLQNELRPWGEGEVALAFRTNWPGAPHEGSALYMLCDRIGIQTHGDWNSEKYPGSIWKPEKGVIYYLDEVTRLLDSEEYTGPRGSAA